MISELILKVFNYLSKIEDIVRKMTHSARKDWFCNLVKIYKSVLNFGSHLLREVTDFINLLK